MKIAFNADFFEHANESREQEGLPKSKGYSFIAAALNINIVIFIIFIIEYIASFILSLNIPVYRSVTSYYIKNMRGLPSFYGNYMRSLYWRRRFKSMGQNVMIDQNVFIAHPKTISISDFAFIDKNVIIMSNNSTIGYRVHIAANVFVNGGGSFQIDDHAGVAPGVQIFTSTEVIGGGARCSGPMTRPKERRVLRSKVVIEQDAFIGAGAIILPGVTVKQGAVVGAGSTVTKDCDAWGIYVSPQARKIAEREPVNFPT